MLGLLGRPLHPARERPRHVVSPVGEDADELRHPVFDDDDIGRVGADRDDDVSATCAPYGRDGPTDRERDEIDVDGPKAGRQRGVDARVDRLLEPGDEQSVDDRALFSLLLVNRIEVHQNVRDRNRQLILHEERQRLADLIDRLTGHGHVAREDALSSDSEHDILRLEATG